MSSSSGTTKASPKLCAFICHVYGVSYLLQQTPCVAAYISLGNFCNIQQLVQVQVNVTETTQVFLLKCVHSMCFIQISCLFLRLAFISSAALWNMTSRSVVGGYRLVIVLPEDCRILGCYVLSPGKCLTTCRSSVLSQSSGSLRDLFVRFVHSQYIFLHICSSTLTIVDAGLSGTLVQFGAHLCCPRRWGNVGAMCVKIHGRNTSYRRCENDWTWCGLVCEIICCNSRCERTQ